MKQFLACVAICFGVCTFVVLFLTSPLPGPDVFLAVVAFTAIPSALILWGFFSLKLIDEHYKKRAIDAYGEDLAKAVPKALDDAGYVIVERQVISDLMVDASDDALENQCGITSSEIDHFMKERGIDAHIAHKGDET